MNRPQRSVREWVVQHPVIDHLPGLGLAVLAVWTGAFTTLPDGDRTTLVIGATTVAALVMAAATFICAMTYQSANILMTQVRQRHAAALRRNWFSIIAGCFAAAILPILTVLTPASVSLAVAACLYSMGLVAARFARAMFWMSYTLFMQEADDVRPTVRVAQDLPGDQ